MRTASVVATRSEGGYFHTQMLETGPLIGGGKGVKMITSACMESETLLWSEPNWTGYLDKYEEISGLWNRRFFLLQGPFLFYFLNELDRSSPLGLLALEGSQVTESPREGSRKYSLVIKIGPQYAGLGKHDEYILATTSAESLKNVIQRLDDAADPPESLFGYLHKTWARAGELRGFLAKSSSDKKLLASAQGLEAQAIKTELVKSYLEMEELLKRVENKVSEADKKEQDLLKSTALRDILRTKGNESKKTSSISKLQYEIKLTKELSQTLQRKANYLQGQGLEDLTEESRKLLKRLLRLAMEVIHERHAKIRAEAPRYSFPVNARIYNRAGELSKVSTLEFAKNNAGVQVPHKIAPKPSLSTSIIPSPSRAQPIPVASQTSSATKGEPPSSKSPQTSIPFQVTSPYSHASLRRPPPPPLRPPLSSSSAPPLRPQLPVSTTLSSSKTTLQNSPTQASEEPVPSSQTFSLLSPLMLLKSFLPSQFRVPKFAPFCTSSATAPPSVDAVHSEAKPSTTVPQPPAAPRFPLKQPLFHRNPDLDSLASNAPASPAPPLSPLQLRNPGPTSIRPNLPSTTVPPLSSLATQQNSSMLSSPANSLVRPVSRPSPRPTMLLGGIHPSQMTSPGPTTLQQRIPLAKAPTMPATHIATALRGKLPDASAGSKTPLTGPPAPPVRPPGGPTTAGSLATSEKPRMPSVIRPTEAKPGPFSQPPVAPPKSSASIVKSEPPKPSAPSNMSNQPLPSSPLPIRSPSPHTIPTTSSSFPPPLNVSPASLRGKLPPSSAFQPPKPDAIGCRPTLPSASPAPALSMSQSPRPITDPVKVHPSERSKQPVSVPSQIIKPSSNASPPPRIAPQPRLPFPGQPPSRALMLFPPFEFKIPFIPSRLPTPGFNPSSNLDTPKPSTLSKPPSPSPTGMSSTPQPRPKAPGIGSPPAQSPLPSSHRPPTRSPSPYRQPSPPPPSLPSPSPSPPQLLKKPVGLRSSDAQPPPRSSSQPAGAPPGPPPPPVLSTTSQGNKVATHLPSEKLEETSAKRAPSPQGTRPPPSPPETSAKRAPSPQGTRPPPSPPETSAKRAPSPPGTRPPPPTPAPSIPHCPRPMPPQLSPPAGARPPPPFSPAVPPPHISPPPPLSQGMGMAPSMFKPPPPTPPPPQPPPPLQSPQLPKTDSGYRPALKEAAATAPSPPGPSLMSQSPRPVTSITAPTTFRPPPPPPTPLPTYRSLSPPPAPSLISQSPRLVTSSNMFRPVPPRALPTPAAPHCPTIPSAGPLRRSSSSPSFLPSLALATPAPFLQQKTPPPPLPLWLPRGNLHRPPPTHVDLKSKVVQVISQSVPQGGSQGSSVRDRPFPKLAVDENTEELLDTVGFAALNLLKHIFNQAESYIQHNQDIVLRGVEVSKDWIQKALPSNGKDKAESSRETGSDASIDAEKRDQMIELRQPKSSELDKRDEPPESERESGIKAAEMRDSDIRKSEEVTQTRAASTEIENRDKAAETRESEIEKHDEATQTRESASTETSRDSQTEKRNEGTQTASTQPDDTKESNKADSRISEKTAPSQEVVERIAPDLSESLPEAESLKLAFKKQKTVESSSSVNEQVRNRVEPPVVQRDQLKPIKADICAPSQRKAPRQQETLHLQNSAGLRPLPILKARKAPKQQVCPDSYAVSQNISPAVERPVKRDNRACYSQPNDAYRSINTPRRQVQGDEYGKMYSPQEQCQSGSYRRMPTPQQQGENGSYQRMMNTSHRRPYTPQISRHAMLRRPVRMDYVLFSDVDLTMDSQQGDLRNYSEGAARHQAPSPTPSSRSVASIVSSRHPSASSTSDSESGSEDNDSDASTPQISIDLSCTYEFDFISRR